MMLMHSQHLPDSPVASDKSRKPMPTAAPGDRDSPAHTEANSSTV